MTRTCIDAGHGGEPGAVYKGRRESDDNLALGKAVAAELRRHGVIVDETRTGDTTHLVERSNFETGNLRYFISFHRTPKPSRPKGETYTYLNPEQRPRDWRKNQTTWVLALPIRR